MMKQPTSHKLRNNVLNSKNQGEANVPITKGTVLKLPAGWLSFCFKT